MQSVWLLLVAAVAVTGPLVLNGSFAPGVGECKTPWKDCGSTGLKINNVIVQDCCSSPCKVKLGSDTKFSFTFTPNQDYTYLNQSVCGELATACIKFPNETFGYMCHCPGCTLEPPCPFKANRMENVTVEVPLSASFPKDLEVFAQWRITDPDNKRVGCFEVPVETVD
ncbi:NPC intracellular cholesterol transporter 2 [Geodia barretti]|uniref:NPC intracellular cholesterol transporter 2 n=1 Tax=Geodia barretti TaxID=519541 RepID=A0AA35WXB6_GEOBA|nr:NPC intracellular cholesterol transporter 2 [Geodia barretti]